MALMVRKKVGSSNSSFVETMNQISAKQLVSDVSGIDDNIDFGFDGPDFDDIHDENDGPPLESEEYEPPHELPMQKSVTASPPMRKPLRKPAMPVKDSHNLEAPPAAPSVISSLSKIPVSNSERSRLSCDLSRNHHRRLKIVSVMTGKNIMAIIEGWIDEHCPALPEP